MAVFQKMSKIKTEQQKQRQKLGGAVNNNDEPRASRAVASVGGTALGRDCICCKRHRQNLLMVAYSFSQAMAEAETRRWKISQTSGFELSQGAAKRTQLEMCIWLLSSKVNIVLIWADLFANKFKRLKPSVSEVC